MAALWVLGAAFPAGAGEPLSIGALFGPDANAVLLSTVPAAMDIAQKACKATADTCGIRPVKIADLPESVRRSLSATYPKDVVEQANLHFGMPLNDPQMGIGFLNTVGMIAAGGGTVMGMTFGNDVYVECKLEDLSTQAEARSLVSHELVHVAQYQALGFSKYKELYAKETASKGSYEENALEKEAFLFQDRFPRPGDRAFFAFYRSADRPEQVATKDQGLRALDALAGVENEEVTLTAGGEELSRQMTLVLGSNEPASGRIAPQILDPHGGEPLYVFTGFAGPVTLVANLRASETGPYLLAIGSDEGVEVAWRTARGFRTQRFPANARLEEHNGTAQVVAGTERWNWTGTAFERT